MKKIAVLVTCHNRKDKTINSILALQKAYLNAVDQVEIILYLVDDGSKDGTQNAIKQIEWKFKVKIYNGSGSLFWAGGMRYAWQEAIKDGGYDGYLWLNDDTYLCDTIFSEINAIDSFSFQQYGKAGVYIGTTASSNGNFTYGGYVMENKFFNSIRPVLPSNNNFLSVDMGTGNIVYVPQEIVNQIGIFDEYYVHGIADSDYTLSVVKNKSPLLIMRGYQGVCEYDHKDDGLNKFINLPIKRRWKFLYSPKGFDLNSLLHYQWKFFPYRVPFVFLSAYLKLLFPSLYKYLRTCIK